MNSLRQLETRLSMVLVDGAVFQLVTDDEAIDDILDFLDGVNQLLRQVTKTTTN